MNRRVLALFPHFNTGGANSHVIAGILGGMVLHGFNVQLRVPASATGGRGPFTRDALPRAVARLAYRVIGVPGVNRLAERRFLRALRSGDVAYLWPGTSLDVYRTAKARGAVVVTERINCHTATARAVLDAEASAIGWPPDHAITDALIAEERAELELADFIFSPSPLVDESLTANGVPTRKILPVSYGWSPDRVGAPGGVNAGSGLKVLFVGLACQRKGAHRLLDAWKLSGVAGQLLFAGRVTDDLLSRRAADFARPDVVRLGHVSDIGTTYRSADAFAFPSFEEGGPLVTYEAMGVGRPVVVSPMGAGRVARDEADGAIVLPPDRPELWAEAFRRLAADDGLRANLGAAAIRRAAAFTWAECGRLRAERLAAVL